MFRKLLCGAGALGASLLTAGTAFAQDAVAAGPIKGPTDPAVLATMVDKGDTAWMLVSSVLVLLMSIPALALFYGGLVRTKNMLSVLMQVFMIVSIAALVWVGWGYTMAFTSGGEGALAPYVGGFSKAFLSGVTATTYAATFSNNVYLPEFVFVIFQMTFACITPALIVGAFAERVKFWPLMLFMVAWLTIVYFPVAHMVWYWAGPDYLIDTVKKAADGSIISQDAGKLWGMGALDFAGGTVVHINAGIAGASASARKPLRRTR
jgi:ammonium transporter, Amt family